MSNKNKKKKTRKHSDIIRCPRCGYVQRANIIRSIPFDTYIHVCVKCKYIITESEWDVNE